MRVPEGKPRQNWQILTPEIRKRQAKSGAYAPFFVPTVNLGNYLPPLL